MAAEAVKEGVSGAESAHRVLVIAALGCLLFGVSQETRTTPYKDAWREANKIPQLLDQVKGSHTQTVQKFYASEGVRADFEAHLGKQYRVSDLTFFGPNDQFSFGVYPPDQKPSIYDVYHYILLAPKFEKLVAFKVDHSSLGAALDNFLKSHGDKLKSIDEVYLMPDHENHDRCELTVDVSVELSNGKKSILPVAPLPPSGNTQWVSAKDIVPAREEPLHVPREASAKPDPLPQYDGPPMHVYCSGVERLPTEEATQLMVKSGLVTVDSDGNVEAFPALRQVWGAVKDLDLGNITPGLSIQARSEEVTNQSKLSFAGLDIDSRFVRIVGPLALVGLTLYLNAYLRNLREVSRDSREAAFYYPWVRLMVSRTYGPVMAATISFLPIVCTLSLFLHSAFTSKLDVAIFVAQVLLVSFSCFKAGRSFLGLRVDLMAQPN